MKTQGSLGLPAGPVSTGSPIPAPGLVGWNVGWTTLGHAVYAACQWAMLVALAKLGTTFAVGQFALALAVTAPVMMLGNLQLRAVLATDARGQFHFRDYVGLRLITTAGALAVIAGIAASGWYRFDTARVLVAMGAAKAVESVSDVAYGLLQRHEIMDRIAVSMMLRGALGLAALTGCLYLGLGVVWGVAGIALAWSMVLVLYDLPNCRAPLAGTRAADRPAARLAALAWLSLPLGVVMLLVSLNANLPVYFIGRLLGEHDAGVFSAMAYVSVGGGFVVGALGQSASPRLADLWARGERRAFGRLLGSMLALAAAVGAAGWLVALAAGRPLLALLYSDAIAARADVFVWLMAAGAFSYVASMLGYAATARRSLRAQPLALGITLAAAAAACALLVPRFGLAGAAVAVLLSSLTNAACFAVLLIGASGRESSGAAA